MRRRCPAPMTLVAAALAMFVGSRSMITHADSVSSSGLSVPVADASTTTEPQVIFDVSPTGGVVTPPAASDGTSSSPLVVLGGSTGLDLNQGQLVVALQNTTNSSNQLTAQELGLVFLSQGFASSGLLKFSLDVNGSLSAPPKLSFDPLSSYGSGSGLEIINPTSFTTNTSSGATATYILEGIPQTSTVVNNPEPLSLWLWLMISIVAFLNVRRARQNRAALATA